MKLEIYRDNKINEFKIFKLNNLSFKYKYSDKEILNNVNLTVVDIYQFQNQISIPLDATAGNFAKLNHKSSMSDTILGLMNMVGESIGSLSCALNKSNNKIVIVGGGLFYPKFIESLQQTIHFYGHNSIALKDGIFAGCYGALNNVINL